MQQCAACAERYECGLRAHGQQGIACLAGIGFTMSLFIGSLSFADAAQMNAVRLGVLSGSLVSAILGYGVLLLAARREAGRWRP